MDKNEILGIQSKLLFEVEQRKLVQKDVYEIIGVKKSSYIRYKNKKMVMGTDVFVRLGRYLKIDFNDLLYPTKEPQLSIASEPIEQYACKSCYEKDKVISELTRTISKLNDIIEDKNYNKINKDTN